VKPTQGLYDVQSLWLADITRDLLSRTNGFNLVDKTGNIRKPADYREGYQTPGTYTVLEAKRDQMHFIYSSPGSIIAGQQ
jgi:hypothetical protein